MTGLSSDEQESARERSRQYGIRDGAFQAIAQGGGENYLSAFALLFQATPFQIGILSALPQLIGTWAQLLCVKALNRYPNRKILTLLGAAGQAAIWLPILVLPILFPEQASWLIIAGAVAYFATGHFALPAWNSLITDLVAPNRRGMYFARRARVMAVTNFGALCGAGLLLEAGRSWGTAWAGFAAIFAGAAIARTFSTLSLAKVNEDAAPEFRRPEQPFRQFLSHSAGTDLRRFLLFSGLMHLAVLIAGPFFVIYMLRDLQLSYMEYAGWLAAGTFGQFVSLKPWGHISDRYGNKKLLMVTGFTVPVLPMLYLISTDLSFLLWINFMGGVVWAGLSLGLQNYVFDAVPPEDRAKGVAASSIVNAAGWFVGAMVGSWLTTVAPAEFSLGFLSFHPASNLPVVFLISGLLRLGVSLCLLGTLREPRAVESAPHYHFMWELPLMKPLSHLLQWTRTR